jgi:riboflavin kinase/FMN adenylyltransferase
MEVIFDIENIDIIDMPVAVTIGTFDGLHVGHQTVIKRVVNLAKRRGLKSVVYTFSNIPKEVTTGKPVKKIITLAEKVRLISKLGVDYLMLIEFNEEHMNIPAETFIKDILLDRLDIKNLVFGHDFRFGKQAKGNINLLIDLKDEYGYNIEEIGAVMIDGMRISSTLIRELLSKGDILEVNKFLGRQHYYRSIVQPGKNIGRTVLGYPTANLKTDISMHSLKPGVYVTQVITNSRKYESITNVGFNPTFNQKELNFETYIFGFSGDLYGREIVVEFLERLRDEKFFETPEKLIETIAQDVENAKSIFNSLRH